MSEIVEKYDKLLQNIRNKFEDFMDDAEKGKDGRGSKTCALNARKNSTEIGKLLKNFRKISIENDKLKPIKKKE